MAGSTAVACDRQRTGSRRRLRLAPATHAVESQTKRPSRVRQRSALFCDGIIAPGSQFGRCCSCRRTPCTRAARSTARGTAQRGSGAGQIRPPRHLPHATAPPAKNLTPLCAHPRMHSAKTTTTTCACTCAACVCACARVCVGISRALSTSTSSLREKFTAWCTSIVSAKSSCRRQSERGRTRMSADVLAGRWLYCSVTPRGFNNGICYRAAAAIGGMGGWVRGEGGGWKEKERGALAAWRRVRGNPSSRHPGSPFLFL